MDFKVAEEMGYEGGLIPAGTLVMCDIAVTKKPEQSKNDPATWSLDIELTVREGKYAGSKFYDRIGTAGKEAYVNMGKQKVMYALEASRNADKTGDYSLESWAALNGMRVLVKVDVETYHNTKHNKWAYKNVTKAFGSPRPDSRNHKYWAAYASGEQPYQTDDLPPLPTNAPAANGADYSGGITGHLDQAIGF